MATPNKRQRTDSTKSSADSTTANDTPTLFRGKDDENNPKDGYGTNIYPIITSNIWNKGNKTFLHTIKTSKYFDFNFGDSQKPFIIPYTTIGFWTSMYNQTDIDLNNTVNFSIYLEGPPPSLSRCSSTLGQVDLNNTIKFLDPLQKMSFRVTFLSGTIEIEVFNITHQRLIQSGTSVLMYDCATSQNLIIGIFSRLYEGINFTSVSDRAPTKQHDVDHIFDAHNDHTTKKKSPS